MKQAAIYLFIILFFSHTSCAQETFRGRDSAVTVFNRTATVEQKVNACFFLTDNYMNMEKYDSAQIWLNNSYEIYKINTPSLFNYFLMSRQAEVYYYNNLLTLGLQTSLQSYKIALQLKDSLLLADACNFTGLFYESMDSCRKALPCFYKAIKYMHDPPYPEKYIDITMPHHIYGNLAENFEKLNDYDSALYYSRKSAEAAATINSMRALALAWQNMGKVYLKKNLPDSSLLMYRRCTAVAQQNQNIDAMLLSFAGMAAGYVQKKQEDSVGLYLEKGFKIMQENPNINSFFAVSFLKDALTMYQWLGNDEGIKRTYLQLTAMDSANIENTSRQVQLIVQHATTAENRMLALEISDTKQKQKINSNRFIIVLLLITILLTAAFVTGYILRQKLRVAKLRNNISKDLHDELGATLSGIKVFSELATDRPELSKAYLDKINTYAGEMLIKMSDIVWAINPDNDNLEKLIARLRNFFMVIAQNKNTKINFEINTDIEERAISMDVRKNIYLIAKEAIHNALKYAAAPNIVVEFKTFHKRAMVRITDDGKGFDLQQEAGGNGLNNIRQRAIEINGSLNIRSRTGEGTVIEVLFKFT